MIVSNVRDADGKRTKVLVDLYMLDEIGRKLMIGARKGVSQEVINLFTENLESNLK